MGYLINDGQTFGYIESIQHQQQLKQNGIMQFINLYKKYQNYTLKDQLKETQNPLSILWGDEIESHVISFDEEKKQVKAVISLNYLFEYFAQNENDLEYVLAPEFCSYMIETCPKSPYCSTIELSETLKNMNKRTESLMKQLKDGQKILTSPVLFLLGTPDLHSEGENYRRTGNLLSNSKCIDDKFLADHPRYETFSKNIKAKRQADCSIKVPIYNDVNTSYEVTEEEPYPGYIHMDSSIFGSGCSGLQATFTAKDMSHARRLYDQMSILSPLFVSLTAGSSIYKGKLSAYDAKQDVLSQSMDDRNPDEMDPLSINYKPQSRWGPVYQFISEEERNLDIYNDGHPFPKNESILEFIQEQSREMEANLDEKMIQHLNFLFQRDSLIMFKDKLNVNNSKETCHFENIQSTNWNSMRLKPPPNMNSQIGWRVELRTMDSQINNQENAAVVNFAYILSRLFYQSDELNLYIPISKVHENFKRSLKMNSILTEKFYFRTNIFSQDAPVIEELTFNEIFFGKQGVFEGLYYAASNIWMDLIQKVDYSNQNFFEFEQTFEFIRQRSTGERQTLAAWMREFVLNHSKYNKDSIVNNDIAFDLLQKITKITSGELKESNFADIY